MKLRWPWAALVLAAACNGSRDRATQPTPTTPPATAPATTTPGLDDAAPKATRSEDRARYRAKIADMKKRLKAAGSDPDRFHFVIEPPFVVAGDEDADTVEQRSKRIVSWAVRHLEAAYFDKRPEDVLEIWLFAGAESYNGHSNAMFRDRPSTPYGYYLPEKGALVMDIFTGGGTLVHEIVHPYIEANFPDCPAWFNEGLGSLYEQSAERDGGIVGLTNWRLPGLQEALRDKSAPPLAKVVASSRDEFYGDQSGDYYAAARYLLYYLQEKGLLQNYYKAFVAGHDTDPSGRQNLEKVLGQSLSKFEPEWRTFVLGLEFR